MQRKAKKASKKSPVSKKPLFWLLLVLAALLGTLCVFKVSNQPIPPVHTNSVANPSPSFNFENKSFVLENNTLKFTNGNYTSSDGSVTAKVTTKTIDTSGNQSAAIIAANFGGSGTFFYLIGASKNNGIESYSEPILLGDRIIVDSISIEDPGAHDNGEIIVNYLNRPANAPMSQDPTIKTTAKYSFEDNGNLIEVLH